MQNTVTHADLKTLYPHILDAQTRCYTARLHGVTDYAQTKALLREVYEGRAQAAQAAPVAAPVAKAKKAAKVLRFTEQTPDALALLTRELDLTRYDIIVINTSAGKDSLVMLHIVVAEAKRQGVFHKLVAVHCDLGRVEWEGTRELAEQQCALYGVPMHVVRRPQGDLLHQIEFERKMFPAQNARFCTSDQKRTQVETLVTKLVAAFVESDPALAHMRPKSRRTIQVLNCLGLRAQESTKRAEEPRFKAAGRGSSSVRQIDRWLPIHAWSEAQVWQTIRENALPYHRAYDLGMGRLSCIFCIFAPESALLIAGYHNRERLAEYVALEGRIGHAFQYDSDTKQPMPLVNIQAKLEAGYIPQGKVDASAWAECSGGM